MVVTAIKQQVKRKDRFSVYIDEKYAFSFGQDELLASGLRIGDDLNESDISVFKAQSEEGKLYDRLLNLLSIRPRSEWEIVTYLRRKKTEPELIEKLMNRLRQRKYLDDQEFARRWVENRRLLKPMSKRKLYAELKAKRVSDDIIRGVLSGDETDELVVLRQMVERKRRQTKYQDNDKLMQYLARQGFNYGDIKTVLDEAE